MTELDALLILNAIGLSPARVRKLIDCVGSAARVVTLNEARVRELALEPLIPLKILEKIEHFPKDSYLKKEYNLVDRHRISLIACHDAAYPRRLKEIFDPPLVLYVKGNPRALEAPGIAMVGSRQATLYGLGVAERFAGELCGVGLSIISGMARGIDAASHRGALKAKGTTLAVMGCGLNHIYPSENERLAEAILESGALVSELPMDMPPLAYNFPGRNRIISGLSLGVIVVEASQKSGALITAEFALEQGREVFAIPGKVDQRNTQGVHRLIKEGAKLATCLEDILEELKWPLKSTLREDSLSEESRSKGSSLNLTNQQKQVYQCLPLRQDEPVHIDRLVDRSGLSVSSLAGVLFELELKKIIKQLPGKMFVRAG